MPFGDMCLFVVRDNSRRHNLEMVDNLRLTIAIPFRAGIALREHLFVFQVVTGAAIRCTELQNPEKEVFLNRNVHFSILNLFVCPAVASVLSENKAFIQSLILLREQ